MKRSVKSMNAMENDLNVAVPKKKKAVNDSRVPLHCSECLKLVPAQSPLYWCELCDCLLCGPCVTRCAGCQEQQRRLAANGPATHQDDAMATLSQSRENNMGSSCVILIDGVEAQPARRDQPTDDASLDASLDASSDLAYCPACADATFERLACSSRKCRRTLGHQATRNDAIAALAVTLASSAISYSVASPDDEVDEYYCADCVRARTYTCASAFCGAKMCVTCLAALCTHCGAPYCLECKTMGLNKGKENKSDGEMKVEWNGDVTWNGFAAKGANLSNGARCCSASQYDDYSDSIS